MFCYRDGRFERPTSSYPGQAAEGPSVAATITPSPEVEAATAFVPGVDTPASPDNTLVIDETAGMGSEDDEGLRNLSQSLLQ